MPKILIHSLRIQKKSFIFWAIGIIALVALYMLIYPSIRDSAKALNDYISKMPEAFKNAFIGQEDYASPVGYISSEVYNQMLPILFLFFSIGFGSEAIAGEEEKGTLDIILSNPIRRSQVILEKFGAMLISLLILCAIVYISLSIGIQFVNLQLDLVKLLGMTSSLFLLALTFGTLSLMIGAITGSKGLAIGLTTALAVLAFFVNAFSAIADFIKNFEKFSPFYHYSHNSPLANGLEWTSILFFVVVSALFLLISLLAFNKRDLEV